MAKSAIEKFKALPQKDLVRHLGCPQTYGLIGIYTLAGKCIVDGIPSPEVCKICWTKRV